MFRPITIPCRLPTLYYFPARVLWHPNHQSLYFIDITRDSISLTLWLAVYPTVMASMIHPHIAAMPVVAALNQG